MSDPSSLTQPTRLRWRESDTGIRPLPGPALAYADRVDGELEPRIDPPAADRAQLRVSVEDRHRVAEMLREAAGEGRLELGELDERLEAAYAARTYADLVPLTADLPAHHAAMPASEPASAARPSSPVAAAPSHERHVAVLGGFDRKGVWTVPQELRITAVLGGASLDLRRATFAAPEVVILLNAFLGGAEVIVGPRTHVVMEGIGILGGFDGPTDKVPAELDDSSPTVRIRGRAVLGGVSVVRKAVPGPGPRILRRRQD